MESNASLHNVLSKIDYDLLGNPTRMWTPHDAITFNPASPNMMTRLQVLILGRGQGKSPNIELLEIL